MQLHNRSNSTPSALSKVQIEMAFSDQYQMGICKKSAFQKLNYHGKKNTTEEARHGSLH